MSITVSGLGSGLTYDSWITQLVAIKQKEIDAVSASVTKITNKGNALNSIETDYTNLNTAIETFTKALASKDVFNQKAVSSSSSSVTATVDANAKVGTVNVTVDTLATATTAQSSYAVASFADSSTKLSSISGGAIQAGKFSVYVGGQKSTIDITADETLGDVLTSLNGITGLSASLSADGKLTIGASSGTATPTVTVGSSSDTSNFSNIMALTPTTNLGVTTYGSSKSIFDTDTSAALTATSFSNSGGASVSVRAGKFTIGDTEFTIDATTTMDGLISKINTSDAGVTAAWDPNSGKLSLTATDPGAVNINVEAGTSNFTDIMGLTNSSWTENAGVFTLDSTALKTDSQTLGTNAKLTINGTTIIAASNTITSDISGIKGLTLTLKDKTTSAAAVAVTQDTSAVASAINSFVTAFNKVIADTDSATGTNGNLHGESVLSSMRNKIRTLATSSVAGANGYTTLASIGITTGAIGTGVKDNTNKLVVDTAALTKALTADPDAVKKVLMGDKTAGTVGVFTKIEEVVDKSTDAVKGYFTTKEKSFDKDKSRLNDRIETMTTKLAKYKKGLETKFAAMDTLIASLKKSASVFDSYFNKSTTTSGSS